MKSQTKFRGAKTSEHLYARLVQLYPKPFSDEFGISMQQVFSSQCGDVIKRAGNWGLIGLWLRTLIDFAFTCSKEHVLALPSLPKRTCENVLRTPTWIYPSLLAASCLFLILIVTFSLTKVYSSSATLLVRKAPVVGPQIPTTDPYFLQTEFVKLASKVVLYPVIETNGLRAVYRERFGLDREPTIQEAYAILSSQIKVSQQRNTELIEVKVYDEDRVLAKTLANGIVANYHKWKLNSAHQAVLRQYGVSSEESSEPDKKAPSKLGASQSQKLKADIARVGGMVVIINPAEEGLRPVRPNRKLNIAVGILISGFIGTVAAFGLRRAKRNRRKSVAVIAPLASA